MAKKEDEKGVSIFQERIGEQKRQLLAVRDTAIKLAEDNPDQFSVCIDRIHDGSRVTVSTDFTVRLDDGPVELTLKIVVSSSDDGEMRNEVNIREEDGEISHRMEMESNPQTDGFLSRINNSSGDLARIISDDHVGRSKDGGEWIIHDNFGETTISAKWALFLLENATDLKRPFTWGPDRSITYRNFKNLRA